MPVVPSLFPVCVRAAVLSAESQFQENYGLAFTQNLKNKDIPEFGSKGTILLNPGYKLKSGQVVTRKSPSPVSPSVCWTCR
jgi:hypothetical protein